ncbi:MAG: flagellar hook-basal body protein [Oscillospiraceae bacterium]|nr:flagellar hook-basal body protein [Oscillospiraceae bacterium]
MNITFFNGVSGLVAYQKDMDVLSHNMANVNTVGFKGSRSSFEELLYTEMDTNGEPKHMTGHGVRVSSVDVLHGQGQIMATNNPLDFAIEGDGFFAVEREGRVEYTRSGAFRISADGNKGYLVTTDGAFVLDSKGKEIKLEKMDDSESYDLSEVMEEIGVYVFPNPYGLEPVDGSSFLENDISGEPETYDYDDDDKPYELRQCALESSNVNLGDQMVDLIVTQRAYQMNAKMVQTGDEIEEIINNLR